MSRSPTFWGAVLFSGGLYVAVLIDAAADQNV